MVLVFTVPAGLCWEQHAKIVEEMAFQVLKANLQHGRGWEEAYFLGQSGMTVALKEDEWRLSASQMQKCCSLLP